MFDTVIFNDILKQQIDIQEVKNLGNLYATRIQYEELGATPDPTMRAKLLHTFEAVGTTRASVSTAILGIATLGEAVLGVGDIYTKIKNLLDTKKKKRSNHNDALIAEAAYYHGHILVTRDVNLREAIEKLAGKSVLLTDLLINQQHKGA
jgi:predicted nucleic acid-binding protein